MTDDQLLDIAVRINRDLKRQQEEQEEEHPASPLAGWSLREQRLYLQHLQRVDRRTSADRRDDAERALIQRLRRLEGLDHDKDWAYKIRPLDPYSF